MSACLGIVKGDGNCLSLQKQRSSPKKRPLTDNSADDDTAVDDGGSSKRPKHSPNSPTVLSSSPLKRSAKKNLITADLSDFSDWDESPVKQEKRSAALRFSDNLSAIKKVSSECHPRSAFSAKDSGVADFPSLNDDSIEVELTVREVRSEDGVMDLICVTDAGHEAIVYLQDQWCEIDIEPGTRVRLIGAQTWANNDWLLTNEHGLMIVAPDTLVPCTSIAGATWCPRKAVLNERFRGPTTANKAMLIGIIVHELFQAALRCSSPQRISRDWLFRVWHANIGVDVIAQLAALRFTPSQFETELEPYVEVIIDWIQTHLPGGRSYTKAPNGFSISRVHDIEENIWTPQLGLKGKIDATLEMKNGLTSKMQSLELKTGKSGASSEHAAQVMLYSMMLSSRYTQPIVEGSLLYLKDGVTRGVKPRALEMKAILNQRNRLAVHLSTLNAEKLPAPKEDPKFCDKCDHALICSVYQVAIEPSKSSSEPMRKFASSTAGHLTENHLEYFKKWIRWIYSEWAEDQARKGSCLKDLWKKPVEQRALEGFCAANLRLSSHVNASTECYSSFLLTFESAVEIPESVFSAGSMCTVSAPRKPALLLVPIVESTSKTITVRGDRLLDYDAIYYIDLYNSFSTYPTTLGNLTLLMGSDEASTRLRELIVDVAPPSRLHADPLSLPQSVRRLLSSTELSAEQRDAVQAALLSSEYTLIEGYPGSGKTTTIVALLRCLLEMNCSVLLTANTHSALDNVLVKLRKHKDESKILRLGKATRDDVADLTLESKLAALDGDKYKAARKILKETPLVASTCHFVPREVLFSWRKFDYCIVDEASMVLEPVVVSALAAAKRFVLVGDAHQLSPLVQSKQCIEEGMSVSLFERLQVHKHALHSLVSQYRMNREIARLSSSLFYDDRLVCANESVASACLMDYGGYLAPLTVNEPWRSVDSAVLEDSVVFIDTLGKTTPKFASSSAGPGQIYNDGEAQLVCDIVSRFVRNGISPDDIGIMCVYRKQVDVIKSLLKGDINVEVNSVDQFQGRDERVIIWSLVWTQTYGKRSDLLRDRRRVNVGLTRAQQKLVLIGCAESMRSIDIMKRLLESVKIVGL
ncbi:hypothetical protein Q1695_004259 [Nippostrongylus brasiliensis]|nr:hypothetical protein Q1695_004259 [Nippostrongylus brasiliensis]